MASVMQVLFAAVAVSLMQISSILGTPMTTINLKVPFEAVFQGICEKHQPCEQLCFNLHESTFECSCRAGYNLNADGYSCTKINDTRIGDPAILYEKEASFVAVLEESDEDSSYQSDYPSQSREDEYDSPHIARLRTDYTDPQLIDRADILSYEKYKERLGGSKESHGRNIYHKIQNKSSLLTSPGPNLEQKVPSSAQPNILATESLSIPCNLNCGMGKCFVPSQRGIPRCQCPLGYSGRHCQPGSRIETARFHGTSWVGFAPLREAYRDIQLTVEFKPEVPDGVLIISGENDDLSGDFMAGVLSQGFLEFRWDCGSGAGMVRSPDPVNLNEWNRLTVYRHRWDVWMQLNSGRHVQGRSEGLFSRITFREPLYVGGVYNMTSLINRLGVSTGLVGCIRRLQVNDHFYKFHKASAEMVVTSSDYHALDGFDISECIGDPCSDVDCVHGKCVIPTIDDADRQGWASSSVCLCPLGYTGQFCEKQLNLDVPSFNGSSHLVFPALGDSVLSWLELEIVFKSASSEGILLYESHRADSSADFIAVTLYDAHLYFTIDLGSGPLTLRSLYPVILGIWHTVFISRTGRKTWMYVDDHPVVEGITPGGFSMLSLSQPLYLGGLAPNEGILPILPSMENFNGCIQKLAVSSRPIRLVSGAVSGSNVGSCSHPCSQKPCENGGLCEPRGPSYICKCPLGFQDNHCRSKIITQVAIPRFSGRSYLKYSDPEIMKRVSGEKMHLWFRFRTSSPEGLLIWIGEHDGVRKGYEEGGDLSGNSDSLSLELVEGSLVLRYNLGSGYAVLIYNGLRNLSDGVWHSVQVTRYEREARLSVDKREEEVVISPGDLIQLNVESFMYVGGHENFKIIKESRVNSGINGCLTDLILATDYHVDLITSASAGQNIDYC